MAARWSSELAGRWIGAAALVGALAHGCTLTHDTDKFRAADDATSSTTAAGGAGGASGTGGGVGSGGGGESAGGMTASSSSGTVECGNAPGQPCCGAGTVACAGSLTCIADVCVTCGGIGEPCCPGFDCSLGQCCDPNIPQEQDCDGAGTACLACCATCSNNGGTHTFTTGVAIAGCGAKAAIKCNEEFGNCDPGNPNKKNCCDEPGKCLNAWFWAASCGP